jgi:pyruvate dehydrogenase E1 component alpha subunit
LRLYLTEAGLWDKDDEERLLETCSQEVEAAADRYLATAPQPPTSMFDHLYGELPADLAEQRAAVSDA